MLLLLLPTAVPIAKPLPSTYTEVSVWDELDNPQGAFPNYTVYDPYQMIALQQQRHVDLRSLTQFDITTQMSMLQLDLQTMATLDRQIIGDLEADVLIQAGEAWTNPNVTVDNDPLRKNWSVLSMTCSPGLNITQSVFST